MARQTTSVACHFVLALVAVMGAMLVVQCASDDDPVTAPSTPTIVRGLLAHWTLDDGGGTAAVEVLNGNHGTLGSGSATPTWLNAADAKLGGALSFDGVDDYVEIPVSPTLNPDSNSVTLSLWVKLRELPSGSGGRYAGIFDSHEDCYVLYLNNFTGTADDELRFKVSDQDGTAERPGIPEANLVLNEWMHVVGVYSGADGEARIYLNGGLQDTHSNVNLTSVVEAGQAAGLGRDGHNDQQYCNCDIDDIGVWGRALTESEILWLYNSGNGRAVP